MGKNKQSLREAVRVLFVNAKLLALLIIAGAAIGGLRAAWQERTFHGNVELATGGSAFAEGMILPNPTELRRLVLDPESLKVLQANEQDASPELQRSIHIEPVVTDADGRTGVWRVNAQVHAATRDEAAEKFHRYAELLQAAFEEKLGLKVVERPRVETIAVNTQSFFQLAAYQPDADHAPQPQPGAEPTGESAEDLERRARRLDVALDDLDVALREARSRLEQNQGQQAAKQRELSVLRSTVRLLQDGARTLPKEVFERRPELELLTKQHDELQQRRSTLETQLKPVHPRLRALDRQLSDLAARQTQVRSELLKSYQSEQAGVEDELQRLTAFEIQQRQRVRELESLQTARDAQRAQAVEAPVEPKKDADVEHAAPPQDAVASRPPEPLILPTLTPSRLAPGTLLVAGPIVDKDPIRPNILRDTLLGALIGLVVGLACVVVRAGADQRVHTPYHLDQLELDVEFFGSIPQLDYEPPVRLTTKSTK